MGSECGDAQQQKVFVSGNVSQGQWIKLLTEATPPLASYIRTGRGNWGNFHGDDQRPQKMVHGRCVRHSSESTQATTNHSIWAQRYISPTTLSAALAPPQFGSTRSRARLFLIDCNPAKAESNDWNVRSLFLATNKENAGFYAISIANSSSHFRMTATACRQRPRYQHDTWGPSATLPYPNNAQGGGGKVVLSRLIIRPQLTRGSDRAHDPP